MVNSVTKKVDTVGPMEQRLRDFGDPCVAPLVFGWWGEINSEFDDLLKYAARGRF